MFRTKLFRRALTAGALLVLAGPAAARTTLSDKEAEQARQLVKQLGDKDFRAREAAKSMLIRMGAAVEPILRQGMTDADPEVRFRSRTILPLAMTYDLERRLQVFLAGKDDKDHPAPASWTKFKELVGDQGKTREMFAAMHRYDGEFLMALESDPAGLQQKMAARCTDFMQERNHSGNTPAPAEQLATLLLASLEPKLKLEPNTQAYFSSALHSLSYQPRSKEMMRSNEVVRKLLVKYITNSSSSTAYNSLYLLANLDLKEGVDIAKSFIKQSDRDPYTRGMAISILGKIGGRANIADVMPFLDDKTSMGETQFGNGNRIKTQLRDVALATLIQLSGQNLHDYDFAYLKMIGRQQGLQFNFHLSPSLLGFSDETSRDASLKKWKDWYAKNKESLAK